MSTLGNDIRAQKVIADRLATDLSTSATALRTQIAATDWVSTAADFCRSTLGQFASALDDRSSQATRFGGTLMTHAHAVDAHAAALADVPGAIANAFQHHPKEDPASRIEWRG